MVFYLQLQNYYPECSLFLHLCCQPCNCHERVELIPFSAYLHWSIKNWVPWTNGIFISSKQIPTAQIPHCCSCWLRLHRRMLTSLPSLPRVSSLHIIIAILTAIANQLKHSIAQCAMFLCLAPLLDRWSNWVAEDLLKWEVYIPNGYYEELIIWWSVLRSVCCILFHSHCILIKFYFFWLPS